MKNILKLLRIKHWVKNLFVFVPLVFARKFTEPDLLFNEIIAFFLFCFAASIIYIFNDIHDVENDRKHPVKKFRPLASGSLSVRTAIISAFVLFLLGLLISLTSNLPDEVFIAIFSYLILNFFYTLKLKRLAIIDILTISAGYVIRVYAGAFAIDVPVSHWLIVTILFLSLFLAALKRGSELKRMQGASDTRSVLDDYSEKLLNNIITVSTTGVIMSYLLYSISDKVYSQFHSYNFLFTAIFVIYGIFRVLFLFYKENKGEDAFELILRDIPSLVNLLLYGISIFVLIYKF